MCPSRFVAPSKQPDLFPSEPCAASDHYLSSLPFWKVCKLSMDNSIHASVYGATDHFLRKSGKVIDTLGFPLLIRNACNCVSTITIVVCTCKAHLISIHFSVACWEAQSLACSHTLQGAFVKRWYYIIRSGRTVKSRYRVCLNVSLSKIITRFVLRLFLRYIAQRVL